MEFNVSKWAKTQWFILDADNQPIRDCITNEIMYFDSKKEAIQHLWWIPKLKYVAFGKFICLSDELKAEFIQQIKTVSFGTQNQTI